MTEQNEPWWHAAPSEPPVDSVLVEGLKLAAALRDWAVESGAAAAVSELTASAAGAATAYLSQHDTQSSAQSPGTDQPQPVVRCSDCPVCRGLDALDRANPQMAQTARSALAGINALIAGLLPGDERASD